MEIAAMARLPIIPEDHEDLEEGLIRNPEDVNLCVCCNGPWCRYTVPCVIGFNVACCTGLLVFVILGYVMGNQLFQ
jgi:hypothetical protein